MSHESACYFGIRTTWVMFTYTHMYIFIWLCNLSENTVFANYLMYGVLLFQHFCVALKLSVCVSAYAWVHIQVHVIIMNVGG